MTAAEVRFAVRLTPRGGADRIEGVVDGALRVRVAAPPVDEAANRALLRLLSRELGVAPSALRIVSGTSARSKTVAVEGTTAQAILTQWPGLRL